MGWLPDDHLEVGEGLDRMENKIRHILMYSLLTLGLFGIFVYLLVITNSLTNLYQSLGIIGLVFVSLIFGISLIYFTLSLFFKTSITHGNSKQSIYNKDSRQCDKFWRSCLRFFKYLLVIKNETKQSNSIKQSHDNSECCAQLLNHAPTISQAKTDNNHDESEPHITIHFVSYCFTGIKFEVTEHYIYFCSFWHFLKFSQGLEWRTLGGLDILVKIAQKPMLVLRCSQRNDL
jgi:hypothetical protein